MRQLNHKEEQLMQTLWQLGRGFLKEIMAELPPPKPPVTTVSSIVRKLEKEGFIAYESIGNSHRYYPAVEKADYRAAALKHLLNNYFQDSAEELLSQAVEEAEVPYGELEKLLSKIKKQQDNNNKD
jgi:BlaI family transcriptional regulator, penicillinase repressor